MTTTLLELDVRITLINVTLRESMACPECDASLTLSNVGRGDILTCLDCGGDLEVVSIEPLLLELAPMVAEDIGE